MLQHKKLRYAFAREQLAISKLSIRQLLIRNKYVHSVAVLGLQSDLNRVRLVHLSRWNDANAKANASTNFPSEAWLRNSLGLMLMSSCDVG